MGRSKDLATGETRFVNTAGDTMTGKLALTQANSNTPPFVIEAATEPNDFSVSGYSDGNGAYYMLGANMYLNSGGNTATWESSENSAGILLDSRGTNGVEFSTGTGTGTVNLKVDGSGRVTKPNQPYAIVRFSSQDDGAYNQSGSSGGSNRTAKPQNIVANVGNHYSTSTGKFTCPVAGVYQVQASGNVWTDHAGGWIMPTIRKNGSTYLFHYNNTVSGQTWFHNATFSNVKCSANDTLEIYLQTQSGNGGGFDIGNYSQISFMLVA